MLPEDSSVCCLSEQVFSVRAVLRLNATAKKKANNVMNKPVLSFKPYRSEDCMMQIYQ